MQGNHVLYVAHALPTSERAVGYVPSSLHPDAVAHAASSPKASRFTMTTRGG